MSTTANWFYIFNSDGDEWVTSDTVDSGDFGVYSEAHNYLTYDEAARVAARIKRVHGCGSLVVLADHGEVEE